MQTENKCAGKTSALGHHPITGIAFLQHHKWRDRMQVLTSSVVLGIELRALPSLGKDLITEPGPTMDQKRLIPTTVMDYPEKQ